MIHDTIVKAWAVLIKNDSINAGADRQRRTSRRFAPQLGQNALEGRMALSSFTVTLTDPPEDPSTPTMNDVEQVDA
jgi:hypothetical protein